ncbi:MAG TPA: FAD-dependent oxidoreductase, partial [Miltoncostaea sp.]|nr:FAD-dependent oxidoreductase [Miltoncostaea sp.]
MIAPYDAPPAVRRVLVAGGGIAGVEAVLALRAFAGDAVDVIVVDPGRRFTVPGTAPARAFGMGEGIDLRLADVVDRAGATLVGGRVASVDGGRHLATLDGGELLSYDALVLAVGARPLTAVPGALTFAGPGDVEAVRGMVDDVSRRGLRGAGVEMAFVVPEGCGWPLAAYELALMTREHLEAEDAGDHVSISVVTSEDAPLGLFGPDASASVARSLARARIDVVAGVSARRWDAGRLELADGHSLWADRVIALPVYRGPAIAGLPADADGFIPAEDDGRVPGVPDVWAVGDGTTNPVKQGGVACRQADAAAAAIADVFGVPVDEPPAHGGLSAWMWDGRRGRS